METYIVKRLEQAKLLTDPFKLKLLERFALNPSTTKQVADRMGEKAPKLYRHVDALVDEGLLTLVEEKRKRGTIERYYKTVADRFEVDPTLFSTSRDKEHNAVEMLRSVMRDTESELVRWFDEHEVIDPDSDDVPLIMKFGVRGTPEQVAEMRNKLEAWLEESKTAGCGVEDNPDFVSYSGFIAFYQRPGEE
ncbi:MAG: helix-turn-helix domain-containing protein [Gammaproteobacteria bacterium]|nr:helix-turn-helix domain-containing protein [Gammaproteobacteria bacterium]